MQRGHASVDVIRERRYRAKPTATTSQQVRENTMHTAGIVALRHSCSNIYVRRENVKITF